MYIFNSSPDCFLVYTWNQALKYFFRKFHSSKPLLVPRILPLTVWFSMKLLFQVARLLPLERYFRSEIRYDPLQNCLFSPTLLLTRTLSKEKLFPQFQNYHLRSRVLEWGGIEDPVRPHCPGSITVWCGCVTGSYAISVSRSDVGPFQVGMPWKCHENAHLGSPCCLSLWARQTQKSLVGDDSRYFGLGPWMHGIVLPLGCIHLPCAPT